MVLHAVRGGSCTVIQHDTAHRDAQSVHAGEIGQSEAPRLMDLTENNFTLLAVQGTPGAYAPLERTPDGARQFRAAPEHLLEYRDGRHTGR
jgi:hypothetical protein